MNFPSRHRRRGWTAALLAATAALLAGCWGADRTDGPSASTGQVGAAASSGPVSFYAASRFAEQATFGPTPTLVAEIRAKGFEKWIDEQLAMAPTLLDPTVLEPTLRVEPEPTTSWRAYRTAFPNLAIAAPDQLRARVAWSLSQFIVISDRKVSNYGTMHWTNLLLREAFSNYRDLLYQVSIHPAMGWYLDNSQNRPKSPECPHCAPNENYARELMQLFALGVVKLNPDGTPVKDSRGAPVETYSQRDVEELARVLTGWMNDPVPQDRPTRNHANYAKPMVPSTWPPERDSGAKVVLGRQFPAGQSQAKDLSDAVDLLMNHQNIAPFVASRMIQHLVKSDPSPAYVARIGAVFRNNGAGVAGDMKAVVKAILLDPEARAGDVPGSRSTGGKLREPFLHFTTLWRGMECRQVPYGGQWGPYMPQLQNPFSPESVFSFYAPTDRAPGSNLLAPEQRLVNARELSDRLNRAHANLWDETTRQDSARNILAAGCNLDPLVQSFTNNPAEYLQWISDRYFRGAMPPMLRADMLTLMREPAWNPNQPAAGPLRMLDFALSTPYFGAIK